MHTQEISVNSELRVNNVVLKCEYANEIWIVGYLSEQNMISQESGYVLYATSGRDAIHHFSNNTPADGAHLIYIVNGQYPGRLKVNAGDLQRGKSFPLYCIDDPSRLQGYVQF